MAELFRKAGDLASNGLAWTKSAIEAEAAKRKADREKLFMQKAFTRLQATLVDARELIPERIGAKLIAEGLTADAINSVSSWEDLDRLIKLPAFLEAEKHVQAEKPKREAAAKRKAKLAEIAAFYADPSSVVIGEMIGVPFGAAVASLHDQHMTMLRVLEQLRVHWADGPTETRKDLDKRIPIVKAIFAQNAGGEIVGDPKKMSSYRLTMETKAWAEYAPTYTLDWALRLVMEVFDRVLTDIPSSAEAKLVRSALKGGNRWLGMDDVPGSIFEAKPGVCPLHLGPDTSGDFDLNFGGEGSLITLAPPGAGKTQCQVMPNLVRWTGPVIVLDIKGECFEQTAGWRKTNVGPILRFAPYEPSQSASYNPLQFVSQEPEKLWRDARLLADQLIVGGSKDPYWDNRARDLLTACIAFVVLTHPEDKRTMAAVMDCLSPGPERLQVMITAMKQAEIAPLVRFGKQLEGLQASDKQREGIFDSARAHLSIWEDGSLDAITQTSDWHPSDFRGSPAPSLYLTVPPGKVKTYASLLRVIVAQHIQALTEELPERDAQPVLILLDELPQLGHFKPVEEALEVGRQYGLKLWLFAQNKGQLDTAYPNAEGLIGNCAVQSFMNPDASTALWLSQVMGTEKDLISGKEEPLASPQELQGPEFTDKVVVLGRGAYPALVWKSFAYNDPSVSSRLGLSTG